MRFDHLTRCIRGILSQHRKPQFELFWVVLTLTALSANAALLPHAYL